ncbi:MAG: peptide/nickel transport system permease protein [Blastocatellia bacterium]|jgi:peptide/nickel transport system permease protein|nr:peptide/nickel transport system permease protein [Blastocatellia bacterium]
MTEMLVPHYRFLQTDVAFGQSVSAGRATVWLAWLSVVYRQAGGQIDSRLKREAMKDKLRMVSEGRTTASCSLIIARSTFLCGKMRAVLKLILNRALQGLLVLLIISALVFALLAATGGDALSALSADPLVSEETVESLRHVYELDQPLPVRYTRWLMKAARGDLGESFYYRAPVSSLLWPRLLSTLLLATVALLLAWTVALLLGSLAARRKGSWIDRACGLLILLATSTPRIVLALVALAFAARTQWFSIGVDTGGAGSVASLRRVLLPALVLCVPLIALFLAQTREGLKAALAEEFVQVARAKGLTERAVVLRHALRAALNPLITIFGYSLGGVVSGSVIVETTLGWPGLGQLSVVAVRSRDVPLLMGVVLVTATAVLIGNMLADILLRLNDPRLREDESRAASAEITAAAATPAA